MTGSCRDAIKQVWPAELQATAVTILSKENGLELANRIGGVNSDPWHSQDFGCMQINNHWHSQWFASHTWSDPVQNVAEGLEIYRTQGITAWYAVKGVLW